ncbi:MAG: asparagine synthase (glutamine-hydrolyzing) [Holophagales bacterium]|nr:MAG: asparagine synthase (glutamine-hydrolyzing) [Holophagales bacterium]
MCGILGVSGPRGRELVGLLLPRLAHRGPDGAGVWSDRSLALGHRRLAIIGVDAGGAQPMEHAATGSQVVFNGEIFNYLEIADELEREGHPVARRYDTAVLLAALEAWGVDCLARLNGMFAFAWYRPREQRVLLVRDRWGKKPLFWGRIRLDDGSRVLAFSSELRPLAELPGGPPPPCALGVARYLVYDGMPGSATVYSGIEKLPPGEWLELDPDGSAPKRGRYFRFEPAPRRWHVGEAEDALLAGLEQSVRLRLRSDVPVGLFLSGGLDSSLLAAVWRRVEPRGQLRTFTVGFDDSTFDERESARLVARWFGAEHHEVIATGRELERELETVWRGLSEPFGDPSIIPTSLVCRFAREHVTVALGGDGGDELQGGYDPFRAWRLSRLIDHLHARRPAAAAARLLERLLPANPGNMSVRFKVRHFGQGFLHGPSERIPGWMASFSLGSALSVMRPELAAQVSLEEVLQPSRDAFNGSLHHGELAGQVATWVQTYLESSILTKVDRASMLHSLEVRAPFLDPDLAGFLSSLPAELIFRQGRGKVLMRQLAKRMLPAEVLAKPKKGLGVPQTDWLRTVLRERLEDSLQGSRHDEWYQSDEIAAMWRDHLSGRRDHRKAIWNFLFSWPFRTR